MPKRDLVFDKKLLNAAGTLGFSPDAHAPVPWNEFCAFITNPISMRARLPTENPALIEYPGGFLLHTGLPNPGFRKVLQQHQQSWGQASLPIIVHLMAGRLEETREMVRALEGADNILAIELGFADHVADDLILLTVNMCTGELPMIACLPSHQILWLGQRILAAGAAALSIAPPRGALTRPADLVSGRLFGPSLFPMALEVVRAAVKIGLPIIGAAGALPTIEVQAMLAAGAKAVELDCSLWLPG